jgi:hypothetical protein
MSVSIRCEQFCANLIGPDGQPGTEDSRACCPECDRLIDWLTYDVFPAIRKHGYYAPPDAGMDEELDALIGQDGWQATMLRLLGDIGLPDPIAE